MKKKIVAVFMVFSLILTTVSAMFEQKVQAYQNNSYYNQVRVGLKSMAALSVKVTLNGDYAVSGQTIPSGTVATLTISNGKILFNGMGYDVLNFNPALKSNTISLTSGTKNYKYFGIMSFKILSNQIFAIDMVNIEDYLKGVVGLEMSDYFPVESLKVQAIAARNYTLANLGLYSASGYDLDDTISCQAYGGYNENDKNVIAAVEATRGQVALYNEALVQAFYSASDGGYTEAVENVWASSLPYSKAKKDDFDSELWPGGNKTFAATQIESVLKTKGYLASTDKFGKLDLTSITRFLSGRVASIDILYTNSLGVQKKITLTKDKTRTFLAFPSSMYTVTYDAVANAYTFSGKGNGHGVGMSQIGAKNRATAGQKYNDILKFYYDGAYIQSLLAKLSSFTVDKTFTLIGQAVTFNAQGKDGSGQGYLYKYVVAQDGNIVYTKDYSQDKGLSYKPMAPGNYQVTVYVKDVLSDAVFEDQKQVAFTAYATPTVNTIIDKSATLVNQNVTISAQGNGGSSQGYLYKYVVSQSGNVIFTKADSADAAMVYTPTTAGDYNVTIYLKDAISTDVYDTQKSVAFTAYNTPTVNGTTVKTETMIGQPITVNAQGSGGSPQGYLYKYVVSQNGNAVFTKEYSTDTTMVYTPTTAGDYSVTIYLKDNLSTNDYDAQKEVTFTTYDVPQISDVSASGTLYEKRPVSVNVQAVSGSGTILNYQYELYKDGVLIDSKVFSTNSSYNFTPAAYGSYSAAVYVKNVVSSNSYDVTKTVPITILREPIVVSKLPISQGMKGTDVVAIQNGLTKLGYNVGIVDGIFGSKTYNGVVGFQKTKGIAATGIVDQITLDAMNTALITK